MDSRVSIFDRSINTYIDIFNLLFVHVTKETILPEVLEIFGNDLALKFLDIFAGTTIEVPDRDFIVSIIRDADVYNSLEKKKSTVKLLAKRYDVSEPKISDIYNSVKEIVDSYKMRR